MYLLVSPPALPSKQPEVLEQLSGLKEFWMDGNRLTFIPGVCISNFKDFDYFCLSFAFLRIIHFKYI